MCDKYNIVTNIIKIDKQKNKTNTFIRSIQRPSLVRTHLKVCCIKHVTRNVLCAAIF